MNNLNERNYFFLNNKSTMNNYIFMTLHKTLTIEIFFFSNHMI